MSTRPSIPVKGIAISAAALGAAIALIVPMSASAAAPVSQAEGRLLVATIAGGPSDPLLGLAGAKATDSTGQNGPYVTDTPLDASALSNLVGITVPVGVALPDVFGITGAGIIKLGGVGQYGQANDDGSSVAFSGTVAQAANPLLGIGTTSVTPFDAGSTAGDVEIGLGTTADPVSANLTIGAVAASAQQPVSGSPAGHYLLGDVNAVVGGTVVSGVVNGLNTVGVQTVIATLNTALGLAGQPAITNPLATGTITISATELLAAAGVADLNHLAPGTDLLQYLPQAVITKVTSLVTSLTTSLTGALTTLGLTAIDPLFTTVNGVIATLTSGASALVAGPIASAIALLATLKVNNQTTNPDGSFTQNALTLTVVPGTTPAATVQLANATVGPNAGPTAVTPGGPGTTPAALLAETGVTVPVGATLAGAGLLAAAGFGLTRLAAWRRRGTHRGVTSTR